MDNTKHRRLQELDRSDFEIVKGEPDIRGWDVRNTSGQKIGEVEELIVDAQKKKVRYMVVDLDNNELKLNHRKVLIPIGLAELHKDDDDVILPLASAEHLNTLPAYDKDNLDEEVERNICSIFGRKTEVTTSTTSTKTAEHRDDFYQHDYFNDDNLYKHRLHEAKPKQPKKESEYEKGLRLWEMRSEGVVPNTAQSKDGEGEVNEEARIEKVRNRRKSYEDRRGHSDHRNSGYHYRKDRSYEQRIHDEGLQDADE